MALESLKGHSESYGPKEVTSSTIILLSNFAGIDNEEAVEESIPSIIQGFRIIGAQLIVL